MKRAELLQGLREMKFVELNGRVKRRSLTQGQAAEIPGVSARNLIERFFNKIKQCRRAATRYDKLAANYLAFIKLAAI